MHCTKEHWDPGNISRLLENVGTGNRDDVLEREHKDLGKLNIRNHRDDPLRNVLSDTSPRSCL